MQKQAKQIQEFYSKLSFLQILSKIIFGLVNFEYSLYLTH